MKWSKELRDAKKRFNSAEKKVSSFHDGGNVMAWRSAKEWRDRETRMCQAREELKSAWEHLMLMVDTEGDRTNVPR